MTYAFASNVITQSDEASQSITAVADGGSSTLDFTCSAHGYSVDDLITISGTTSYNGLYTITAVADANTFTTSDTTIDNVSNTFGATETGNVARGDKDLSGLSGLTDVTVETVGPKTFYIVASGTRVVHTGGVNWDSERECLVVEDSQNDCFNASSGTTIIGRIVGTNKDGGLRYSKTVGLVLAGIRNSQNQERAQINGTARLVCLGSEVHFAAVFSIEGSATAEFTDTVLVNINLNQSLQAARNETGQDQVVFNNVTFDGIAEPSVFFQLNGIDIFTGQLRNCFVQHRVGGFTGPLLLADLVINNNLFPDGLFQILSVNTNPSRTQPIEITNCDAGSNIGFFEEDPVANRGHLAVFQNIKFTTEDISGNSVDNVKFYLPTTDNGNRTNLVSLDLQNGRDFEGTTFSLYESETSSGETSTFKVLTGRIFCDRQNSIPPTRDLYSITNTAGTDDYQAFTCGYLFNLSTEGVILQAASDITRNVILISDTLITETTKATVDAYTTIDTAQEFYDRAKSFLFDNFAGETSVLMSRQGDVALLTDANITIDATAASAFDYTSGTPDNFTLHSDTFTGGVTTTGTITLQNGTLLNGGTFTGDITTADSGVTYTNITATKIIHTVTTTATLNLDGSDVTEIEVTGGGTLTVNLSNGASVTTATETSGTITQIQNVNITAPNIIDDSRVQIFNTTKSSELDNSVVSGGSGYSLEVNLLGSTVDVNDEIRLRATYQVGTSAREQIEASGILTSTGLSFINTQVNQETYNSYGVDGSTITEFSWDSGNVEIDINDPNNETELQRFGAWYYNFITTSTGIDEAFGAITWNTLNQLEINSSVVDVTFDNLKTTPLLITGGRIFRDDGSTVIASTSNSIQIDYEPVYVTSGGSGGTTPQAIWEYDISGFTTDGQAGKELLDAASGSGGGGSVNAETGLLNRSP